MGSLVDGSDVLHLFRDLTKICHKLFNIGVLNVESTELVVECSEET